MARILKVDADFTPCPVDDGDELFHNGIFVFNITRMREYIRDQPSRTILEEVAIKDYPRGFSSINETHLDTVDISQPVIVAEIAPGQYSLIDGHHRMEKVRRTGINRIPAYRLSVQQHMRFLTSQSAYTAYIEYWNDKLKSG
jgi:ParB-like nuclease family protein